jgi:hypothetical protein
MNQAHPMCKSTELLTHQSAHMNKNIPPASKLQYPQSE